MRLLLTGGIALYQKLGLGFVPDEVAGVEPPENQYTVVAINPKRVSAGYGCQQPERDSGISASCHLPLVTTRMPP